MQEDSGKQLDCGTPKDNTIHLCHTCECDPYIPQARAEEKVTSDGMFWVVVIIFLALVSGVFALVDRRPDLRV